MIRAIKVIKVIRMIRDIRVIKKLSNQTVGRARIPPFITLTIAITPITLFNLITIIFLHAQMILKQA